MLMYNQTTMAGDDYTGGHISYASSHLPNNKMLSVIHGLIIVP